MNPVSVALLRLCLILSTLVPMAAMAQEPATAPPPAAAIDPEAMKILVRMADYVAKTPQFSVVIKSGYDAVQKSGQKIEFGATRRISLQRPSGLRVEVEESNGERTLLIYDGKEVTSLDQAHSVYAKTPIEGGVDAAIKHFVGKMQMRLPLAALMLSTFRSELERRVESLEYVEESTITGVRCDHLAARGKDVDFQVWIQQGDKPLPQRVVITYKNDPGEPQFRAQLSEWNFQPKFSKDQFVFTPPKDASQIQFAAQLAAPSGDKGAKP